MFCSCSSLKELPDISEWKVNNIINIDCIFKKCSSLFSLPNISKWKLNNKTNINSIFDGCSSLITYPDISKWNINKNNLDLNNDNSSRNRSFQSVNDSLDKIIKNNVGSSPIFNKPNTLEEEIISNKSDNCNKSINHLNESYNDIKINEIENQLFKQNDELNEFYENFYQY